MQRGRVCGSVCLFVPWTGTGSIADSNEMEATSGDRGRMETGSFVFGFFVVSSSFVFFVCRLASSPTRNVVRNYEASVQRSWWESRRFFPDRTRQTKQGGKANVKT